MGRPFWRVALVLVALMVQGAWGQEFGQQQNLKGKTFCLYIFTEQFVFQIKDPPLGFDQAAWGRELVGLLKRRLQGVGIPLREEISCVGSDADVGLTFLLLPIRRGGSIEGYAITSSLEVRDWTSHPYPVMVWEDWRLLVTVSRTATDLKRVLEELASEMVTDLIVDWFRANR